MEVHCAPGAGEVQVSLVKREQEDEQDKEKMTLPPAPTEGPVKTEAGTTEERLLKTEEGTVENVPEHQTDTKVERSMKTEEGTVAVKVPEPQNDTKVERSMKTEEDTVEMKLEVVPEHQNDNKVLLDALLKPTSREVTEASATEAHDDAAPTDPATVCIKQEEEENDVTVELKGKMRPQEESDEAVRKKMRLEPLFPEDYTVPSFSPDCPVGMEFLVPKSGFFCKVCSKFYSGTDEAKKNHCKTLKHYQNLEKSLEKWRASKGP
ncbi:hypothetical protein UPYG_G00044360 [Umbra pygmaea]|uniref:Matrin-type domain-containing protein n=1 Tax=Umbra pygmaea TaxID=75934 RepID=A0ABD0XSX7_UMBPY